MRRSKRAGQPSQGTLPGIRTDEPIDVLRRLRPLHRLILDAVHAAEERGVVVTVDKLVRRLRALGHPTSTCEVRGKVDELARLGLVWRNRDGSIEAWLTTPVVGEIS